MLGTEKFYAAFESHEYFSRFDWLSLKSQKLNERRARFAHSQIESDWLAFKNQVRKQS